MIIRPTRITTVCTLAAAILLVWSAANAAAQTPAENPKPAIELGTPFVDNAVLQRQMSVPVWGWSKPGNKITVEFAGQRKSATSGEDGKWMLQLDALEADATPREMVVIDDRGERVVLKNLLVGEVWFASGQSNMDWVAGKSMCRELATQLSRSTEEIPIREFQVDIGSALFPQSRTTAEGGWKSSREAGGFSALALSFAWDLHEHLQVPIGIIRSSHGATPIETWTAYEGFAGHPKLQDIAERIRQSDPSTPDGRRAYAQFYEDLKQWQVDGEKRIQRMRAIGAMDCSLTWLRQDGLYISRPGTVLTRPSLPGIAAEWKGASRMYNMKIAPLIPYAIRGAIWCQGTHNAGDGRIYAAKMEALVSGWRKNWNRPELPFYFTQMQCYGEPDPDNVGFADIREAQTLFFMNAKNVGMALQVDLNSANPGGIHNFNKLHPGQRLARWALAHQYGKEIAYTGPIYKSHSIRGNSVRVQFEQRGPGGGLMVGSKGLAADYRKDPPAYFEPARPTPGEKLKHFRLAGKDRVWHAAEAVIEGDEVVVTAKDVPAPVGVQYAYSASPIGANLYNEAGLPAVPFAYFDGKQLFNEDLPEAIAEARAAEEAEANPPQPKPYLQVMTPLRDGAVIQRDKPVHVWGFAVAGTEVTVAFGDQKKTTRVNEFDQWRFQLDPMPASTEGRALSVTCSDGATATIRDVVVGDVWILTGSTALSSELAYPGREPDAVPPPAMPLLREFKIRTKARRFRVPRKRNMEVGGGKYRSSWRPALFTEAERDTSAAGYYFASQVRQPNVPIGVITLGADNPPLTWVSYEGMQTAAGFEKERDELNLLYPDTGVCKAAVTEYIATLEKYCDEITAWRKAGRDIPRALGERAPDFPQPYYDQWASETETATHTYNFCISPNTPLAVSGVVWIPGEKNMGQDPSRYTAALEAYALSLPQTYGQEKVAFIYAHPDAALVEGVVKPRIENSVSLEFAQWPKSLEDVATRLGALAGN
jgi:sialate O-acetylesterase